MLKEDILAHVEGAKPAPTPAFVPPVAPVPATPALQQVLRIDFFKKLQY